jgi:cbb3-type cytochrome oxidase subunit 1
MKKESALSLFRIVLTVVGSWLIGREFFGKPIDEAYWIEISGIVLVIVSSTWGIIDKTLSKEKIESAIRSVVIFVSAVAAGRGWFNQTTAAAILEAIPIILMFFQSNITRSKNTEIKQQTLNVQALKSNTPTK